MKRANRLNAAAAVFIGEDELERGAVTLRDMDCGDQEEVPLSELAEHLSRYL